MHADFMSERNIDVQIIGPRPFMMMGWMQPHLARVEAAARQNAFDDSHPAASATAPGLGSVPLDAEASVGVRYDK